MKKHFAILGAVAGLVILCAALAPAAAPPRSGLERTEAARAAFAAVKATYDAGSGALDPVYLWSQRWLTAQQESGTARSAASADHLARMRALETAVRGKLQQGFATKADGHAATYYRAEAELWARKP